jgi:hypothetical protein
MSREDAIVDNMVSGMVHALGHDREFQEAAFKLRELYTFSTDELVTFAFKAIKLGYEHRILEEAAENGMIDSLPVDLDDDTEGVMGVKMATKFIAENT